MVEERGIVSCNAGRRNLVLASPTLALALTLGKQKEHMQDQILLLAADSMVRLGCTLGVGVGVGVGNMRNNVVHYVKGMASVRKN